MNMEIPLTNMTEADRSGVLHLATQVGWQFTGAQFDTFLGCGNLFGHRQNGMLVSSAALFPYGKTWASIGIVIVDPDLHRNGLGHKLVAHCLDTWESPLHGPVTLIATPMGYPVYTSFGFETITYVSRMQRKASPLRIQRRIKGGVSGLTELELEEICALDREATGASRERMLAAIMKHTVQGFVCRDERGHMAGFATVSDRGSSLLIGPVVASTVDVATSIVIAILGALPNQNLRLDVPVSQSAFLEALRCIDFSETRDPSPVMSFGGRQLPGDRFKYFAIADPALG